MKEELDETDDKNKKTLNKNPAAKVTAKARRRQRPRAGFRRTGQHSCVVAFLAPSHAEFVPRISARFATQEIYTEMPDNCSPEHMKDFVATWMAAVSDSQGQAATLCSEFLGACSHEKGSL